MANYNNYNNRRPNNGYNQNRQQNNFSSNKQNEEKRIDFTSTTYVDKAEEVIKVLADANRGKPKLSTSKIRNILSLVSDIYNDVMLEANSVLDEKYVSRIQYIKMRIAYEAGREPDVKNFVNEAGLIYNINKIGNDKQKLILFCHYVEALVAYHRFYGGADN